MLNLIIPGWILINRQRKGSYQVYLRMSSSCSAQMMFDRLLPFEGLKLLFLSWLYLHNQESDRDDENLKEVIVFKNYELVVKGDNHSRG